LFLVRSSLQGADSFGRKVVGDCEYGAFWVSFYVFEAVLVDEVSDVSDDLCLGDSCEEACDVVVVLVQPV
jgi:hypothetical protein